MKALTLSQPWATLVMIGAKQIETRSWRTDYRGPLAIHSAKGFPSFAKNFALGYARRFVMPPHERPDKEIIEAYPRGCVLAVVQLVDVVRAEKMIVHLSEQEKALGDYGAGRFAWILEDPKPIWPRPIQTKGQLGLWNWDEKTAGTAKSR